jgi:hypothetical protein
MPFGVDIDHKHRATNFVLNILLCSENLKGKDNLEDLGVDGKLIKNGS